MPLPCLKAKSIIHSVLIWNVLLFSSCEVTYDYIYPPFRTALKSLENRKIVMVSESLEDTFVVKTGFISTFFDSKKYAFTGREENYQIFILNGFSKESGIDRMCEFTLDEYNSIEANFHLNGSPAGFFNFDNSLQGFNLAFSGTYDLHGVTYNNLLIDYKSNGLLSDPVFIYSIEKGLLMARNPNNLNELVYRCFECE